MNKASVTNFLSLIFELCIEANPVDLSMLLTFLCWAVQSQEFKGDVLDQISAEPA